ncbi:uncharacterized protein LOC119578250 [Penaeus monodon]|uniref:uncharacterized protein LOC119578250 n=1 Tax=Penaeus monodon TaxID=6687 RepID=UPI0018A714BF|nr:uncharacterized protein LOC119578250 [Penaeus monodon]
MKSVGANKMGKLAQHFSSESHKAALADFARFSLRECHIDIKINEQSKEKLIQENADEERNKSVIRILFDVAKTLARQSIAFRGHASDEDANFMQIVNLISRHCPDLNHWLSSRRLKPYSTKYMGPSSQNEIIEFLARDVRSKVKEEIDDAKMFSVSADTTPDAANQDRMIVAARYVASDSIARERTVEMKECKDKHGEKIAKSNLNSLESNQINVDGLCFQTYDFASSMSGRIRGTQKVLQDLLERPVPYIPCQAHRSNTFNEHSAKASSLVTSMYALLEEIYVFFNASIFMDAIQDVENCLKLRNLSKTRWVYGSESIEAVWRSLNSIAPAIDKIITDVECKMECKIREMP